MKTEVTVSDCEVRGVRLDVTSAWHAEWVLIIVHAQGSGMRWANSCSGLLAPAGAIQ